MKRILLLALVVALLVVGIAGAAAAAPDNAAQQIKQGIVGFYDGIDARTPSQNGSTSLGDAIQGGFYGNAANPRPGGHGTLPSLAPGPKVCVYVDGACVDAVRGNSWGAYKNAKTDDDPLGGMLNPSNH